MDPSSKAVLRGYFATRNDTLSVGSMVSPTVFLSVAPAEAATWLLISVPGDGAEVVVLRDGQRIRLRPED